MSRERVVQADAVVEQLFWLVEPAERGVTIPPQAWMPYRNHLGHLLVGLKKELPNCERILVDATTSSRHGALKAGSPGRRDRTGAHR